jgi:hypothetical protein
MIDYYITPIISSVVIILAAKFALPLFTKILRLDIQVLHIMQGIMICYALIFGIISPLARLLMYTYHFITPF